MADQFCDPSPLSFAKENYDAWKIVSTAAIVLIVVSVFLAMIAVPTHCLDLRHRWSWDGRYGSWESKGIEDSYSRLRLCATFAAFLVIFIEDIPQLLIIVYFFRFRNDSQGTDCLNKFAADPGSLHVARLVRESNIIGLIWEDKVILFGFVISLLSLNWKGLQSCVVTMRYHQHSGLTNGHGKGMITMGFCCFGCVALFAGPYFLITVPIGLTSTAGGIAVLVFCILAATCFCFCCCMSCWCGELGECEKKVFSDVDGSSCIIKRACSRLVEIYGIFMFHGVYDYDYDE